MTLTLEPGADAATPQVHVLMDRCAGCQECVVRCPTGALSMDTRRWVALGESTACVGCRQCVRTCPFSAILVEGPPTVTVRIDPASVHPDLLLGDVEEIRRGFSGWEEALSEAARCLSCPDPTCVRGCPAHNDIPAFIAAVRARDLEGAAAALRRTTVLPDVCARVCNQAAQCEGACTWSLAGGSPVAIGRLERFVSEQLPTEGPKAPATAIELSVAIVGSGPAAIGAAWDLVEAGASVTVFEKDETPGGLCIWGIPDFTLPDAVATRAWRQLVEAGVDLHVGREVLPSDFESLLQAHDALLLAYGAGAPMRLKVPGAELDGVADATSFLKGGKAALEPGGDPAAFLEGFGLGHDVAATGRRLPRVLVVGAGNTAMDVARTARRLGLEALCIDWLAEPFALARPDELYEARTEGVEVRFLRTLTALGGEAGRVSWAQLATTTQDRAESTPKVDTDATEKVEVDLVVMAMGYRVEPRFTETYPALPLRRSVKGVPDRTWLASGILANNASAAAFESPVGKLALGREVGLVAAQLPIERRTWVAGDALVGPSTVVEAMAQGRRAAGAIIDARPVRFGLGGSSSVGAAPRVLVCFESQGGRTASLARAISEALEEGSRSVRCLPIAKVGPSELAAADVLVVGTWVEGLVVAKVRPARAMRNWLEALPPLAGRSVAIFCSYAIAPKGALAEVRRAIGARGGEVLIEASFGTRGIRTHEPAQLAADFLGLHAVAKR